MKIESLYAGNTRGEEMGDFVIEYLVENGIPREEISRPYRDYIMVYHKVGMTFSPEGEVHVGGIDIDINRPDSFPKILKMIRDQLR